ncbi:hypothetical protein [Massilia antarctica]|uniref:hypothetical protein n=1 Tax=Massilia antarctica TaxID=2765360 RepID=UPI00227216AD|nr:hypothetical protein [Massilia sp. H27-R4]MCY0916439.1 hypothetical protein [Massilia sp. H27-R4]
MQDNPRSELDCADAQLSRSDFFDFAQVSPELTAQSRKNHSTILDFINNVTATAVAERMGIHESSVSRAKSHGQVAFFARLLAAAGLKVVPANSVVYLQPDEYR